MRRRTSHTRPLALLLVSAVVLAAVFVVAQDGLAPLRPADVVRSDFVYPQQAPTIRFSHAKHAETSCTTCHGAASTSRRSRDDLSPSMTACAGCHADEAAPALQDCAGCHVGYPQRSPEPVRTPEQWRAVRPAPMRVPAAPPNLRFDHAAHGALVACSTCHAAASNGEPQLPDEASCVGCHDGTTATSTCTSCHPTDASTGRIATSRPGIDVKLRPDNHSVDWMRRHATVAKANNTDCMSCHTEEDCASCHVESVTTPFSAHPPNFLTMHAVDARQNAGNCTDCHAVQTFCTTCHVRAEVTTRADHEPPPRRELHPAGWLDASMPNNHGVMARRDIVECASCHTETDCITCHTAINPHPPEFALECRTMLMRNQTSCVKCHSDMSALQLLCR